MSDSVHPEHRYFLNVRMAGLEGLQQLDTLLKRAQKRALLRFVIREVKAVAEGEYIDGLDYQVEAEIVAGGQELIDALVQSGRYTFTETAIS